MRKNWIIGTLLLALIAAIPAASQNNFRLSGEKIAQLEAHVFKDWHGNQVPVSSFERKVVIIDFWETWCSPCVKAFPTFQKVLDNYDGEVVILAATCGWHNDRNDVMRFKRGNDYNFIYVDGSEIVDLLDIKTIPMKIILDRQGRFHSIQSGFYGKEDEYEKLSRVIEQTRP